MNHLKDAKMYVRQADSVCAERMQAYAQLAIAHALIAIADRLEQNADFEEALALASQADRDAAGMREYRKGEKNECHRNLCQEQEIVDPAAYH